jgi:DNA-binding NarL/FixJ family response regulator
MTIIRVVVADDQPLVRTGLTTILDAQPDMTVIGTAEDGVNAVKTCSDLQPDVVLMDIRMPALDGLEATRQLLREGATTLSIKVLILTTFDVDEYVYQALRAGASGFLLKDATPEALVDAVRAAVSGHILVSPQTTRRLISQWRQPVPPASVLNAIGQLTNRERDVLALVAEGLNNTEIGSALFIEETTVKTHVSHVLAKLQARDRVQLVIAAYEAGIAQA